MCWAERSLSKGGRAYEQYLQVRADIRLFLYAAHRGRSAAEHLVARRHPLRAPCCSKDLTEALGHERVVVCALLVEGLVQR